MKPVIFCLAAAGMLSSSALLAQSDTSLNETDEAPRFAPSASQVLERAARKRDLALYAEDGGDLSQSFAEIEAAYQALKSLVEQLEPGTPEWIEAVRSAVKSGRDLVWRHLENRDEASAKPVIEDMESWLSAYDVDAPLAVMRLPLTRLYDAKFMIAFDNRDDEAKRAITERRMALTADVDAYPGDFVELADQRWRSLWHGRFDISYEERIKQACELVDDMYLVLPEERTLSRVVDCEVKTAEFARADNDIETFEAAIERARAKLSDYIAEWGPDIPLYVRLMEVDILDEEASLASKRGNKERRAERLLEKARLIARVLDGKAYAQTNTREVTNWVTNSWTGVGAIAFIDLPGIETARQADDAKIALFTDLVETLEPSRKARPKSISIAAAIAGLLGPVTQIYVEREEYSKAAEAGARATAALEDARVMDALADYPTDAMPTCHARSWYIRALIKMDRADDAVGAYELYDASCGAWLRKYPWEFYTHQYSTGLAYRLGTYLFAKQRYDEALPILQFGSDWGGSTASFLLADMHLNGRGVAVDDDRAAALFKLAGKQGFKRFTVPVDYAGEKVGSHVFVRHYGDAPRCKATAEPLDPEKYCAGFEGVDDQALWYDEMRGGTFPEDAQNAFRKLDQISRENDVSFPDLAVYALNSAQELNAQEEETPTATPKLALADQPLTTTPPKVTNSRFYAFSRAGLKREALVIAPGQCFRYEFTVKPEPRRVMIREVLEGPAQPNEANDNPEPPSKSATRRVRESEVSLQNGVIARNLCFDKRRALGLHNVQVFVGEKSLGSTFFVRVESSRLFEKDEERKPETPQQIAKVED